MFPLSGLGVDLLARAIKNLDQINGLIVIIGNHEVKPTMYGDHIVFKELNPVQRCMEFCVKLF